NIVVRSYFANSSKVFIPIEANAFVAGRPILGNIVAIEIPLFNTLYPHKKILNFITKKDPRQTSVLDLFTIIFVINLLMQIQGLLGSLYPYQSLRHQFQVVG